MGETPDDIRNDVERVRARLGQNLNALESRVKSEFDLRVQYERRPWAFLGALFGLAALAGFATKRGKRALEAGHGERILLPSRYGRVWIEETSPPVRRRTFQRAFSRAYSAS
jgi:hypothetical protein